MDTAVTTPRHAPVAAAPAPGLDVEHVVVMGVAGSGKTTVATLLAARLGVEYAEADEFHSPENIAKMSAGTPLTDADRAPWLAAIRDWLTAEADAGRPGVVTCSALKRSYRDVLRSARGRVRFVHLTGTPELLAERMSSRSATTRTASPSTSPRRPRRSPSPCWHGSPPPDRPPHRRRGHPCHPRTGPRP
ncbi:gluconate kinase (SKI family) [Isoptericola variabilis J7]|uniref:gluconokinase n=1 Tax=Isoptericola variabilis TaxID=139208 RepID=UPI0011ADB56C|nr:gluconate kinase (SKI family) [Isoptericola variabilis J7]